MASYAADPLFNPFAGSFHGLAIHDAHDIGVVILSGDGAPESLGLAPLAPIGFLDSLQQGTLARASVTVLGYGADENGLATAQRRVTQMPFLGAAPHWLFLQGNHVATDSGTVGHGDSGGPELVTVGGTEYFVAINNFMSGGTAGGYRVDTESAQSFIQAEIEANP